MTTRTLRPSRADRPLGGIWFAGWGDGTATDGSVIANKGSPKTLLPFLNENDLEESLCPSPGFLLLEPASELGVLKLLCGSLDQG